jgi:aminoglycoside phosphotransferase
MVNIMVQDGNLSGIIDWERAGFFPVWWEFAAAGIGQGPEDKSWKTMLQKHMPRFDQEREWWLDFWLLAKMDPRAKERGLLVEEDVKEERPTAQSTLQG